MLVILRGTTSELPLIGITTNRNYQLLELPIFAIFNRNTEREPGPSRGWSH